MAARPTNTTYLSVNTGEESYAPKSPDLSGTFDDFETEDIPHPQHQGYRGSISHYGPYTPTTEPTRSPWGSVSQQGGLPYGQPYAQPQIQPQYSPVPPAPQNQWYARPPSQPHLVPKDSMVKEEDHDYTPGGAGPRGGAGRSSRVKREEGSFAGFAAASNGPSVHDIEVKTKFPIARIKRIMQADEDVGKVAQVTPVAVSKALELFMISLVTKAATQAKARNSKRVLAAHLKEAIATDEQFDFLTDIVSKVADAPAANAKKEDADSDEAEAANAGGKKKRAPRARKRKDSDEF